MQDCLGRISGAHSLTLDELERRSGFVNDHIRELRKSQAQSQGARHGMGGSRQAHFGTRLCHAHNPVPECLLTLERSRGNQPRCCRSPRGADHHHSKVQSSQLHHISPCDASRTQIHLSFYILSQSIRTGTTRPSHHFPGLFSARRLTGSPPCLLRLEGVGVLADPLPGDLLTSREPHVGVGGEGLDDVLERLESTGLADETGVERCGV
jgi:hypothetical protein